MTSLVVLRHEGFLLEVGDDGLPRVRDLDLAERLGYERPRDIRKNIARWSKEASEIVVARTLRTPMPRGGERENLSAEYWLTERQALFITTKSETSQSTTVTLALIDAFIAARNDLREISLSVTRAVSQNKVSYGMLRDLIAQAEGNLARGDDPTDVCRLLTDVALGAIFLGERDADNSRRFQDVLVLLAAKPKPEGNIYAAVSHNKDLIKVGHTRQKDVTARVRQLHAANQEPWRLIGSFPGSRKQEMALHQRLKPWLEHRQEYYSNVRGMRKCLRTHTSDMTQFTIAGLRS